MASGDRSPSPDTSPSPGRPRGLEQERVYAAERNANVVRLAVVVLNAVVYTVLMDKAGTVPWLAYTLLAAAGGYAVFVLVAEPYRRYPAMASGAFTSVTDGTLIVLWLVATGGWTSPFYVLWYLSIAAVAYRFGPRETLVAATAYGAAYAVLAVPAGPPLAEVAIRIGYIGLIAMLAAMVSSDFLDQIAARRETEDLARRLEEEIEERRRAERELADALSLARATLQATDDGILVADTDGTVVDSNERFREMWGLDADAVPTGTDVGEVASRLERRLEGTGPVTTFEVDLDDAEERTGQVDLDDGRVLQVYSGPVRADDDAPFGRVWSFHDVTELKDTQERLEEHARQLERQNAELGEFAHAVSHDLRTPLSVVIGNLELLESRIGDALDDADRGRLRDASEAADRVEAMLDALLKYVRIDTRGEPLEAVDLEGVADDVLTDLSSEIQETGADVTVGDLPVVEADPAQVYQVILNLVGNALKFHGDEPPEVTVEATRRDGTVEVRVEDQGPGIPADEQDDIFEIFHRGSGTEGIEGSGFGLALCKKVVERHGGEIGVESTPGDGSTFWFTLPAGGDEAAVVDAAGGKQVEA